MTGRPTRPASPARPVAPRRQDGPDWYKDAIIYELRVGAFQDSDGDGIGDFRGLTQRLDYLRDLGVTALWLLDRKSTRLNSSHIQKSRMPSSA